MPDLAAERDLAAFARAQGGVFTRAQATAAGLTRGTVAHRLGTGRWLRLHPQVLVAATSAVDVTGRRWAALLAAGPRSVLSHRTAAALWGLPVAELDVIELTTSAGRTPSVSGAVVRRRRLGAADVEVRHGLGVTSRWRTLVDCLASVDFGEAEALLDRAWRSGLIKPGGLRIEVAARTGCAGTDQLRQLADELGLRRGWDGVGRLSGVLRRAGVSGWSHDVQVATPNGAQQVALGFSAQRLALDVGRRVARTDPRSAPADDTWSNALQLADWRVLRIPWHATVHDQRRTLELVRRAIG